MPLSRRDDQAYGKRAYFVPLLWIVVLIAAYCVLADWRAVPALIAAAVGALN